MSSSERIGYEFDQDTTPTEEMQGPSNLIHEIVEYLKLFDGVSKLKEVEPYDALRVNREIVAKEALKKVLTEVRQKADVLDEYGGPRSRHTDFGVLASVRGEAGVAAVITAVITGEKPIRLYTPDSMDEATSLLHPTVEHDVYAWDRTYKLGESGEEERTVDLVVASRKAIRANRKEMKDKKGKTLFKRIKRIPAILVNK